MSKEFPCDLKGMSEELRLLLAILRSEHDLNARDDLEQYESATINWELFVELAKHHRVYPLIISSLNHVQNPIIPDAVRAALNQLLVRNTLTMLQLSAEMEHVCRSLFEQQIDVLVLKGPVVSEKYYGDLSLRPARDVDLLIDYACFERAEQIFFALGYILESDVPRILNDLQFKTHHLCYYHPVKKVRVELHWKLSKEMVNEPSFIELWNRKRVTEKTNVPVYYLGQEDLFYYLAYHGASHGWFRLRWLVDIDRLIRSGVNWDPAIKLLKKYDAIHYAGQAILLADTALGTSVKAEVKEAIVNQHSQRLANEAMKIIAEVMRSEAAAVTSKDIDSRYEAYFKMLLTTGQKWKSLRGKLYPSSYDAQLLPLPKSMHFLYFPLRPFLWLWRKRKQQASA